MSFRERDTSTDQGRDAERKRRLALSAVAGLVVHVLRIVISLVSVPLTISYLGLERYGLWLTVSSMISLISFADFGIGNGLLTEVAHAQGREDAEKVRVLASSAFFSMSVIALLLGSVSYFLVPRVAWATLFGVTSPVAQSETVSVVVTLLSIFVLGIPTSLAERIQTGCQMAYIPTVWSALGQIVSLVGLLVVTRLELGLVPLVLCISGAPALARIANTIWYFSGPGKSYRPSIEQVSFATAKRLARIGAMFVVLQAAAAIAFLSDNFVLANAMGADKVPELAVPAKLLNFLLIPVQLITLPLWPAYGEAVSRGDRSWAHRTLRESIRKSVGFVAIGGSLLVLIGDPIVRLWTKGEVGASLEILAPLLAVSILTAWGTNVGIFLNGIGKLREQVVCAALMAVGSFALKWALARHMGLAGIPVATALAYVLITFIPLTVLLRRMFATPEWS